VRADFEYTAIKRSETVRSERVRADFEYAASLTGLESER